MQRILIALFLCGALAFGSVWSERAVDDALGAVETDIEAGAVEQAHQKWEQAQTLLGSLLLHTEVDQADRLFDRVLAAKAAGSEVDFQLERAELLAQIAHLRDLQCPTVRNLL